ncbi:MAG: ATP-binding protein [Byssovorax sp.]
MVSPSARLERPLVRAELIAAGWETFSGLLFVSSVVPAAFGAAFPALVFLGSMAISAGLAAAAAAAEQRARALALAAAFRMPVWLVALIPQIQRGGFRVMVTAFAFGLMAYGMRRAIYRRLLEPLDAALSDEEYRRGIRARLAESATVAGIAGGHVMLLFSVAFLRAQSQVVFDAWFEIVPIMAVGGTLGFTLAVRPATSVVLRALEAGPSADPALLARALARAEALPAWLAYLNFGVWSACTALGVLRTKLGPVSWELGDAVMQVAVGLLFAFGVAFYQRVWHRDAMAPAEERLRRWTSIEKRVEPTPLRRRMLFDFGLPLLFTAALSLLSSIGLYRALGPELGVREDFNAVSALFASFLMLLLAAGGVVARAAGELSRPMTALAAAADRVAKGQLEAAVPRVLGPIEVVGLGESIERMREALARTIAELSEERAGLEANVAARTAELTFALAELKRTQAALVQGERLATIGELYAGVAHEIYNPLNAVAGAAVPLEGLAADLREVLDAYREAEAELPPERRRALEALRARLDLAGSLDDLGGIATVIKRATDRAVKIVGNLKSFSRVSGELAPADLNEGLEETLMLLGPRMRKAGIEVERRYGELPSVICSAGELNQVYLNLLVNAIQALDPEGKGEAAAPPARRIVVETRVEGDSAVVSVADNGPGVPEPFAARIFDPFFTTKPKGQGTGLGLSISTEILRRHGGSLGLDRPEGGGARFTCRIPLGKGAASGRPAAR